MRLKGKRFLSLLMCVVMVLIINPTLTFAATANTAYLDSNGIMQTVNATVIDSSVTTLTSGWYVAKGTVSTGKITISGDVKLILADGASLTATSNSVNDAGIRVTTSNSLTIFGQTNGTGKLSAKGGSYGAGIGGNLNDTSGTINIYGGTVEAIGQAGAGIGGGENGYAGTININGGIIFASGGYSGPGIGNGYGASFNSGSGTVNIYGGTITALSTIGSGIGGGSDNSAGTVRIYGGTVTAKATSTDNGHVGIGLGYTCYISGGSVNATRISPEPTNGSVNGGDTLYRTIVKLNDVNATTKVTSLTKSVAYYGTKGLYTDATGKLYLWLPEGANVSAATTAESAAAGGSYMGGVKTTSSGTASGSLTWNQQPTDITLLSSSLAENVALGSTCGTLNTTDANTGDTFTYSLVSGAGDTDNSAFSISGQNLDLNVIPDYETKSSYSIRLRSTDACGLYFEETFVITIININEAPVITAPATLSVLMDTPTAITGISLADVDAGSGIVAAKVSVTSGTLAATSGGGVTVQSSMLTELTLLGSISNINSFLEAGKLSFTSELGSHAPVTLSITLNDSGNSGSGGAQTASTNVSISILYPATVNSVSVPTNGSYKAGDNLDFTVNFDKVISVDTSGGTPYLPLTIGGSAVRADYLSGNGSSALVFRYTVASGDEDSDGVSLGNVINLNGGVIQSEHINAVLTLNSIPSTVGVFVDTTKTPVASVTPANADTNVPVSGTITVNFGEPMSAHTGVVTLTKSGDSPITLDANTGKWTSNTAYTIPYSGLSYDTNYVITISCFQDMAGNDMDSDTGRSFTTEAEPLTPSVTQSKLTIYKNEVGSITVNFGQGATAATGASISVDNSSIVSVSAPQITTSSSITVTGLTVGTTDITIVFNDTVATTQTVTVTVLPVAPIWLFGSTLEVSNVTSKSAVLAWTAAFDSTAITGYKLYQDGVLIATLSGTTTNYEVNGLSASTTYSFQVQAGNVDDVWTTTGPVTNVTTIVVPTSGSEGNPNPSSSTPSSTDPIDTQPAKKPDNPVIANVTVKPSMDRKKHAVVKVSEANIVQAIEKAKKEAIIQGKTLNGIAVTLNIDLPDTAESLDVILSKPILKGLIDANVKWLEINGQLISISIDLDSLKEIQKKSKGDITISISPVTKLTKKARNLIGSRAVYDVSIHYIKKNKNVRITNLGSGRATLSIPYKLGTKENPSFLFAVDIDSSGEAFGIADSTYDGDSGCMIFTTDHLSVYGIGYKAPGTKFTSISTH
jgi:hypothetical protein